MGMFSWLDCVTKKQIIADCRRTSYVLVPEAFGGGHIEEPCYDGYGDFGDYDIYDLVADWNHNDIDFERVAKRTMPKRENWEDSKQGERWYWQAVDVWKINLARATAFAAGIDDETMRKMFGNDYKRQIGIMLACHNEDNCLLRYPIKVTYDKYAVYEWCAPSKGDPNQGWVVD